MLQSSFFFFLRLRVTLQLLPLAEHNLRAAAAADKLASALIATALEVDRRALRVHTNRHRFH